MNKEKVDSKVLEKNQKQVWWQPSLIMFARLSVWIVTPVLLGTYLGKYLDEKFDSKPIFLMSIVGFAFLVSMFGLVTEVSKEYRRVEEEEKKKK